MNKNILTVIFLFTITCNGIAEAFISGNWCNEEGIGLSFIGNTVNGDKIIKEEDVEINDPEMIEKGEPLSKRCYKKNVYTVDENGKEKVYKIHYDTDHIRGGCTFISREGLKCNDVVYKRPILSDTWKGITDNNVDKGRANIDTLVNIGTIESPVYNINIDWFGKKYQTTYNFTIKEINGDILYKCQLLYKPSVTEMIPWVSVNRKKNKLESKIVKKIIDIIKEEDKIARTNILRKKTLSQIKEYNLDIKNNPMDVHAYALRGEAYEKIRYFKDAISDYTTVINIVENNKDKYKDFPISNVYFHRALSYDARELFFFAILDYDKVLEMVRSDSGACFNRGLAYQDLHLYSKAIESYTAAIDIEENFTAAYVNRGVMYDEIGRKEEALRDYSKAIQIDNKYILAYHNRGALYRHNKQFDKAIKDYEKILEIEPNNIQAVKGMKIAQRGLSDLRSMQ